ncbi:MAG: DUF1848 family protein [Deltaproteobacteria bacterium]|nr:DUF1848 family protein [Deltaproteobacteria bacterium]
MPGFHAEWLAERLGRFRRPPEALFLWTKHPAELVRPGPLRDAVRRVPNAFVQLTITGLGAGPLEPRAPAWEDALAEVPGLIGVVGGDARRVLWRFDPVIPGRSSRDVFVRLASRLGTLGVRRCTTSFLSTMSLKGSLLPQYAPFGLAPPGVAERVEWVAALAASAGAAGMELRLCCQPKVVERLGGIVRAASCIDAELATALHPEGRAIVPARDRSQRRHCGCAPSLDVGDYRGHACRTGCAYCYSSAGGPGVRFS